MRFTLLLVALTLVVALVVAGPLRDRDINYEIEHLLRGRYSDEVRLQDEVTIRHGTFNTSTSISINGSLNPAACYQASQEIAAIYYDRMLPNATYIDYNGATPVFVFTGATDINPALLQLSIANGLAAVMCQVGVYGQFHLLGDIIVTQTEEDTFYVGGTCLTSGYVPNPLLGFNPQANNFPQSKTGLLKYSYEGERYHEYKRIINGNDVEFKLNRIEGFSRFAERTPYVSGLHSSDSVVFPERTYTGL